jgi:bacteriophage exclusion system BrxA-like protein
MTVAIEKQGVQYTQALAKGGALLAETRILLLAWRPDEESAALGERVLREDLPGRATARRVLDIVRVFTLRFLTPTDTPARHLCTLVAGNSPRQLYSDLVFYYTALRENLLRDFVVQGYWPAVRAGRLTLSNQDVRSLILDAELDGRIRAPWSAEIKRDMAGRVMMALTDFGLLAELKPAKREILPYRPADGTLVYLAYLLHGEGVTDASLAEQPAWTVFGLEPQDVWNRLDALAGDSWFIVQRAGQVVQITWKYSTMEEVVHALAG